MTTLEEFDKEADKLVRELRDTLSSIRSRIGGNPEQDRSCIIDLGVDPQIVGVRHHVYEAYVGLLQERGFLTNWDEYICGLCLETAWEGPLTNVYDLYELCPNCGRSNHLRDRIKRIHYYIETPPVEEQAVVENDVEMGDISTPSDIKDLSARIKAAQSEMIGPDVTTDGMFGEE